jgi:hypothetical protein
MLASANSEAIVRESTIIAGELRSRPTKGLSAERRSLIACQIKYHIEKTRTRRALAEIKRRGRARRVQS